MANKKSGICEVCNIEVTPFILDRFCDKHYRRFKKYGDPGKVAFNRTKLTVGSPEYIEESVVEIPGPLDTPCWIWQKALTNAGYGLFGYQSGRMEYAHRRSYELFVDDDIDGWYICHECDVPSCCNPDHLFKGTSQDNNYDMTRKGRARKYSLLNEDDVREIRRRLMAEKVTMRQLSYEYGVHEGTIGAIFHRKNWKHVV